MGKRLFIIIAVVCAAAIVIFVTFRLIAGAEDPCSGLPKAARGDDEKAVKCLQEVINEDAGSQKCEKALARLASIYEKRGNLIAARDIYQKLIDAYPGSKNIGPIEAKRSELNIRILTSPLIDSDAFEYKVLRGDSLSKIAKKFGTTIDLIVTANGLDRTDIMSGQKLKVQKSTFSIVVDRSQNILTLKSDDRVIKNYRVATGAGDSTPIGTFKIINKIVNPVWYTIGAVVPPGSPNNILGTRWLGISKPSYGIHGTLDLKSIGKSVTSGCVRMSNTDVEELYMIVPILSEVVILD
jgi:lipoprotein-anchoring transpeptidase ErfK/SrfK